MSDNYNVHTPRHDSLAMDYDEGLRNFMLNVYNYMTFGLAISGLVSLGISMSPGLQMVIWGTPLKWVAIFAPLGMCLAFSFLVDKLSAQTAKWCLTIFACVMGISISSIFMIFKMGSIIQVFFIAACTFGAASIYGHLTKKDLTNMGSFLMMGVMGLVIAGVVNVFMQSSVFTLVISCISVLIFTGLTAFDTQNLKNLYYDTEDAQKDKVGVIGAFTLYLNFINIFLSLLNILGDKKE